MGEDIGGSIEMYDPGLNQWRMQGTMQDPRSHYTPWVPDARKAIVSKMERIIRSTNGTDNLFQQAYNAS